MIVNDNPLVKTNYNNPSLMIVDDFLKKIIFWSENHKKNLWSKKIQIISPNKKKQTKN